MERLHFEERPVDAIKSNPRNSRTHPKKQIAQIAASMTAFGNVNPLLIDEHDVLIAGHGRLAAAKSLALPTVPTILVAGLTESQKRGLMIADNRIAANAGWDRQLLKTELSELMDIGEIDISLVGFEIPEIDQLFSDLEQNSSDPADNAPVGTGPIVTRPGDIWLMGSHKIACGNSLDPAVFNQLCGTERMAAAFLDPPYNVRVSGIVGRGKKQHEEFAMGSGEMTDAEFIEFLTTTLGNAAAVSTDTAIHYVCMDWRHLSALFSAGGAVYCKMLNLIAWVKSNAGQGSFYRSQHEMIGVFRVGEGQHLNNVELGKHGRNRSNVWNYAGVNSFGKDRLTDLRSHPTVKPVAMIVDALKDCTRRNDFVLDCFAGSGSTLMACERAGRVGRLIEYEPRYVDLTVSRWQEFTKKDAINHSTGTTFNETAKAREVTNG